MSDIVAKLDSLRPAPPKEPKKNRHTPYTFEEGLAVIRAFRRGIGIRTIERETGLRYGAIYSKLGAWAMRYAVIVGSPEPIPRLSEEPLPKPKP